MADESDQHLDDLRHMLGHDAGNLARVLEQLTDLMAMINQHAVYCRVDKGPRTGRPPLDVAEMLQVIENVKELLQETLGRWRKPP
jgi:hypothetical protein